MQLRIINILNGVVIYKVDGVSRRATIPKGIRDITEHLLKLEGSCDMPSRPSPKPKAKKAGGK